MSNRPVQLLMFPLSLLLLFVGCQANTPEAIVDAKLKLIKEVVKIVESVDDVESAKAAQARFEKIAAKSKELDDRMSKMEEPSEERIAKMKERYQKTARPLLKKVQDHMFERVNRTADVETDVALRESLKAVRELGF